MAAITDLATLASADIAANDYLVINDSGTDKKVTAASFAPLNLANTFTAAQKIEMENPILALTPLHGFADLSLAAADNGSSVGGRIIVGNNTNASTPAAGHLRIIDKGGTSYRIWPDDSGNLRIWDGNPIGSNDTSGTVVGTQTSSLDSKHITGEALPAIDILAAVQAGAEAVRRFTYRSGAYNGEEFSGVVVDYAPRYGMDRDDEHPAGKSLNVATVIGDLLIAVANLAERVAALEADRG